MKDELRNAILKLAEVKQPQMFPVKVRESGAFAEVVSEGSTKDSPHGTIEGARVRVVLISEGLGNRKNMNYYGPEAIASAPAVFEGKPCFLNHASESEDMDIPERRVEKKCGYYKNLTVQPIDGMTSLVGELHFDLSEAGREGFAKALTSLHYRQEFPSLGSEYVGLSISADGDFDKRMVDWQGETLEVNYVTRFTDAGSCDIVTTPARGGKFLALVESIAGAISKEAKPMKNGLGKSLEQVRSLLSEATKEKDAEVIKKKMTEAHKTFEAFLIEAADAEKKSKGKEDAADGDGENPVKVGHKADLVCPHCNKPISNPPDAEDESACGGKEDEAKDLSSVEDESVDGKGKPPVPSEKPPVPANEDAMESKRIAIKSLLIENGLEKHFDVKEFEKKSIKESRIEIERIGKIVEADRKEVFNKTGYVPAGFRAKVSESNKGIDADEAMAKILKS